MLDTALTPELVEEGLAREFVSVLQQARKSQGLDVTDRVRVAYDSPDPTVKAAIEAHRAWISDEVLAVDMRGAEVPTAAEESINGRPVRYTLERAVTV